MRKQTISPLTNPVQAPPTNPVQAQPQEERQERIIERKSNIISLLTDPPPRQSWDERMQKSLELYDLVLEINSLRQFSKGWKFYTSTFDCKQEIRGRWVAFVGEFKAGKTWIVRKLLNLVLQDDETIHTAGLSLKFPKDANKATANNNIAKINKPNEILKSSDLDLIVLDTAGTNMPTQDDDFTDTRATEYFLRELEMRLCEKVVYVINKYDYDAQTKIKDLIQMLRRIKNNNDERVTIIHNYYDVTALEVLEEKMAEVQSCYLKWDDNKKPILKTWSPHRTYGVFEAEKTTHYFLLRETMGVESNLEERIKHNSQVLEELRNNLLQTVPVVGKDFFARFMDNASVLLETYLKGFSQNTKKLTVQNDLIFSYEKDAKQPTEKEPPFELKELIFTDSGVRSETDAPLDGRVLVDTSKKLYIIIVDAPGISQDQIQQCVNISHHRFTKFFVSVTFPEQNLEEIIRGKPKRGVGTYSFELDDKKNELFVFPRKKERYQPSVMELKNGQLIIRLKMHDDDDDDDE